MSLSPQSASINSTKGNYSLSLLTFIACLVIVGLKLWLVSDQQVVPRYWPHDDLLFLNWATALVQGQWLGDFNVLSLTKVPGLAFFLAACKEIGIRFLLAQQLFHMLAAGLFAVFFRKIGFSHVATVVAFGIILFAPETYSHHQRYLMRDFLYEILSLLILAFWLLSFVTRRWSFLLCSLGAAVSIAFYSIVREEFVAFYPIALVFLAIYFLCNRGLKWSNSVGSLVLLVGLPALCTLSLQEYLREQNSTHYNIPEVMLRDSVEGSVDAAIHALKRIKAEEQISYVYVTQQMLNKAYEVSPALAPLRESIEQMIKAEETPEGALVFVKNGEVLFGSLGWVLLSAAGQEGHFEKPEQSRVFFSAVTNELNTACEEGALDCHDSVSLMLPVKFGPKIYRDTFIAIKNAVSWLFFPPFVSQREIDIYLGGHLDMTPFYAFIVGDEYWGLPEKYFQNKMNFNASKYKSANRELLSGGEKALHHYVLHGAYGDAKLSDDVVAFNAEQYLAAYPTLGSAGVTPLQHFLMFFRTPAINFRADPNPSHSQLRFYLGWIYYLFAMVVAIFGTLWLFSVLCKMLKREEIESYQRFTVLALLIAISGVAVRVAFVGVIYGVLIQGEESTRYMLPALGLYSFCVAIAVGAFITRRSRS